MMKDRAAYYYNQCDTNCAETVLHCAADEWGLCLHPDAYKAIGGFGAGIGCEDFCGAIAGGVAAIGLRHINGRAHATEDFALRCADFLALAVERLGCTGCKELKARYRTEDARCLRTIELALEALEQAERKREGMERI